MDRSGASRAVRPETEKDAQSCQGATELGFPGPTLGKMQSKAAGRTGEPSGHGEETSSEDLGGHYLLAQTEPRRPTGQQLCLMSRCQEEVTTIAGVMSFQDERCLSMALRMTSSLRMQATRASFFGLPAASSRW